MAARCKLFLRNYHVVLFWIVFTNVCAFTQTDINEVHIASRPAAVQKSGNYKKRATIHKNVDLVLVPVTITDNMNRLITGLDKENFKLYENKREQPIQHFSSEDAPVSIGIILDTSSSMASKIARAQEAVRDFCKTATSQDEYFLITFADQPNGATQFISDPDKFQLQLAYAVPHGRTALLDAVYLGLQKMRTAKHARRALLIISDGGDNHSRYTKHEVVSQVKESDVAVYAIGIYDHSFPTQEEVFGPALLSNFAHVSGGRAFAIDDPNDLPIVAAEIGQELRNQYLLGYRPQGMQQDGKWHKIRVKLEVPKRVSLLKVRARAGYYAPKQ